MANKLDILLRYPQRGWPIFPCKPDGKKPLTANGFKDATYEASKIREWHEKWPDANWGMATGEASGVLVVDLDAKSGGFESWEQLRTEYPEPIETITVSTGGGGQHLWFRMPDADIRNSAGLIAPGIDIRANGGYVIVPPSKTKRRYQFRLSPDDVELEPPPDWLLKRLNSRPSQPVAERIPDIVAEGERHQTLISMAAALRNNGFEREEIIAALMALRARRFQDGTHPVTDEEVIQAADWVATKRPGRRLTDLGNAERLIDQYGDKIRFCYDNGKWYLWNKKRWVEDAEADIEIMAYRTVRVIFSEAKNEGDPAKRRELAKWAIQSEARHRIKNMLELAKPIRTISIAQMNSDPMLLNCRNGTVDLRTGDLKPHDPGDYITKIVAADYDPRAECPAWLESLDLWTGGDAELQLYLQKMVGYALTGNTDEHALFFIFGSGNNGKSTFIETLLHLMGDYGQRTRIEALLASWNAGENANPHVARLAGARFVVASEVPEGRKINESLVKDLTGGDRVTARYLHQNPFEFAPTHKLLLVGNYKPRVAGDDLGFWRRMHVIPFNVTIPEERRRPMSEMLQMFAKEASGILTWAVEGCLFWQADNRIEKPPCVENATNEYRTEEDLIQSFLNEECEQHPDYTEGKDVLYTRWKTWTENAGERWAAKQSKRWFTQRLMARGFEHFGHGRSSLKGVRLKTKVV